MALLRTFRLAVRTGIDGIARFDAHLEAYGGQKVVRIQYDTPLRSEFADPALRYGR
jgi:hypothetical protein